MQPPQVDGPVNSAQNVLAGWWQQSARTGRRSLVTQGFSFALFKLQRSAVIRTKCFLSSTFVHALVAPAVMSIWRRNQSSSQTSCTHPALPEYRGGNQTASAMTGVQSMTTRSFTLAREAFLNPRLPERCLAGDGPGRLIAVEVEA